MRFRVFAAAFFAVFCSSALYAQLAERVTFQPATFGHAVHYGLYDAGVRGSGKMTYANTNLANRNSSRGGVVARPYGKEPTKIVGYSQPEYRARVARPLRISRAYMLVNTYDCLCTGGGLIEIPQALPQIKPEAEITVPWKEESIVPPVAPPMPTVESPAVQLPTPPALAVPAVTVLPEAAEESSDIVIPPSLLDQVTSEDGLADPLIPVVDGPVIVIDIDDVPTVGGTDEEVSNIDYTLLGPANDDEEEEASDDGFSIGLDDLFGPANDDEEEEASNDGFSIGLDDLFGPANDDEEEEASNDGFSFETDPFGPANDDEEEEASDDGFSFETDPFGPANDTSDDDGGFDPFNDDNDDDDNPFGE